MPSLPRLRSIAEHNVKTLRQAPLAELSGALGDLGTLLPLMIAMTLNNSIDLSSTLVFSGLANIATGAVYGIPLPVQPMKAIAAVAIAQNLSKDEVAAAGLAMGGAVLLLSVTGSLKWLHRVVPVAVVKGIQVGAGLSLVISAGANLIKPLGWVHPAWDNRIWAVGAFVFLLLSTLLPRVPYALIVFVLGLAIAAATTSKKSPASIWTPHFAVPSQQSWKTGVLDAAIPQLPLTTLNSVLAVVSLAQSLFPDHPPTPSTTSIGLSVAMANLVGCWFNAMPICHGSGGLAGQYRFGARSGSSIIILGVVKFLLGLFVGDGIVPLLQRFPKSLLGIMVIAAGVELSRVGQSVGEARDLWEQVGEENDENITYTKRSLQATSEESRNRWMVMLVTVAGCLAFKNDAVGFAAGLCWHWGLKVPGVLHRMRYGRGRIMLRDGDDAPHGHVPREA
ncbi:unnamed protein product [Zymoseptoria tritici ST99CH_1E4]|uniref:SLC26A/SulP transporter domain-containing protein n=1 Tax=Zymoseptoria tritici ST99CH_1E4 TaxID=1276532 RepID=A0A2H1GBP8_ZYMTR|nr:unnamed protein product [Zymoseptoria tritici ST99CH_1E4]